MNSRIAAIDITRGAAVIAMVFGHVMMTGLAQPSLSLFQPAAQILASVRMPVLMLISGYFAAGLLRKPVERTVDRVSHIAYLTVIWSIIHAITLPRDGLSIEIFVRNLFMPGSVLWFLWALAIYTALLPLVARLPRYPFMAVAALLTTLGFSNTLNIQPYTLNNIMEYALFFYIGALFKDDVDRILTDPFSIKRFLTISAMAISLLIASEVLKHHTDLQLLASVKRIALGFMALYTARVIATIHYLNTFLTWVGRHTLMIYVAHVPLIAMVETTFLHVHPLLDPLLFTAFLVVALIGMEYAARKLHMEWLLARPAWLQNAPGFIAASLRPRPSVQ